MRILHRLKAQTDNLIDDDNGSTLVTAIVAISFVTILAALILSTTLFNLRIKRIDRGAKDDFYYADKAVEDIYTEIGQHVQSIAAAAYEEALASVGRKKTSIETSEQLDFKTAEVAERYYNEKFLNDIKVWLSANVCAPSGAADDVIEAADNKLEGYIVDSSKSYKAHIERIEELDEGGIKNGIKISDLTVVANDENYQATIATDILILTPNMNFFGTNADVSEYAIIANDGMEINGDVTITGNIYAGTNLGEAAREVKSGINIKEGETTLAGDFIVSKGDVSVGDGNAGSSQAKLTITGDADGSSRADFWFDSLKTVEGSNKPYIEANANMFALDDLELNAEESTVKISGNYYGYDDGTLASLNGTDSHSQSSAVLINGNKASLEMLDVKNFVLLGKSYIEPATTPTKEIETAEAVALKTNQQLYLVPIDFLEVPNPTAYSSGTVDDYFKDNNVNIPDTWFATRYLKIKNIVLKNGTVIDPVVNGYENIRPIFGEVDGVTVLARLKYENASGISADINAANIRKINYDIERVKIDNAVYAFLKFNDNQYVAELDATKHETTTIINSKDKTKPADEYSKQFSARTGYIKEIMQGDDSSDINPNAAQLRRRINLSISNSSGKAFNLQKCVILQGPKNDGSIRDYKESSVYSNNAVVSYYIDATDPDAPTDANEKFVIKSISNTAALERYGAYKDNLFKRFKWLCADLDTLSNLPLSASVSKAPDDSSDKYKCVATEFAWTKNSEFPFMTIIDLDIDARETAGTIKIDDDTATNPESNIGEFKLLNDGDSVSGTVNGVIICKGDLEIVDGADIKGTIIAKGTVTFLGDATVAVDRGLVQKRIEDEIRLVKDSDHYRRDFLISYLRDAGNGSALKYQVSKGKNKVKYEAGKQIKYTDYMYMDNWQRGGR